MKPKRKRKYVHVPVQEPMLKRLVILVSVCCNNWSAFDEKGNML